MSRSDIEIKEGAIFVTDAHYNKPKGKDAFLPFIKKIENGEIVTSQLFLLGDIFDTLFGGVPYTAKENQEVIDSIAKIASKIEVVYIEGNHDFRLKKFFPKNVKIFPYKKQPLIARAKNSTVCLSHGDFDAPLIYKIYTAFIRNRFVLFILNIYDNITNHSILNYVDRHMSHKEQCKKIKRFEAFINKRFQRDFKCDYFIDGHFHQNLSIRFHNCKYVNLGAFACNQRYFIVKFDKEQMVLMEKHSI